MRVRSRQLRRVAAVSLATGLALLSAGCNNDSGAEPQPLPPSSDTSSSPIPPSTSPTPTGWESEFSDEQLAKYEKALSRWQDYERESEPTWANPKPTDTTLTFFGTYFYNEDLMQGRLEEYAQAEVRIEGLPNVLWSKALSIRGTSVTIRQCIDPAKVRVTQHGQVIPNSAQPILREIDLSVPEGRADYLIQEIHDLSWGRKKSLCVA